MDVLSSLTGESMIQLSLSVTHLDKVKISIRGNED